MTIPLFQCIPLDQRLKWVKYSAARVLTTGRLCFTRGWNFKNHVHLAISPTIGQPISPSAALFAAQPDTGDIQKKPAILACSRSASAEQTFSIGELNALAASSPAAPINPSTSLARTSDPGLMVASPPKQLFVSRLTNFRSRLIFTVLVCQTCKEQQVRRHDNFVQK